MLRKTPDQLSQKSTPDRDAVPTTIADYALIGDCETAALVSRHGSIDGAYFGTTFPHLLYLVYPTLIPAKDGDSPTAVVSKDGATGDARARRRVKDEPEAAVAAEAGARASTQRVSLSRRSATGRGSMGSR